jgi:ElaB/YqjD/DUF883 family membrane-anchored ribosome-binding protein
MLITSRRALLGDIANSRARALLAAAAAGVLALSLSACEDRSVQAGVNAAQEDATARVDEVADHAENVISNAADRAEALADKAVDETKDALSDAKPKAEALADKAGDQLGKLADATGDAAIKAGNKVAAVGRDAKRRVADREPTGNRSATE